MDAAWEYIKFWGSEGATRIRYKVFVESGLARFIAPKYLKRYGYTQYLKQVPEGWAETLEEALRSGRPELYGRNCENIYAEMTPPLDAVWLSDNVDLQRELDRAVTYCNEKLMGIVDPDVLASRRRVALVVVALMLLFTLLYRFVIKSFSRDYEFSETVGTGKERFKKRSWAVWQRGLFAFIIMAPALISVALWAYYPLARGSLMAFQDYKIVAGTKWVRRGGQLQRGILHAAGLAGVLE